MGKGVRRRTLKVMTPSSGKVSEKMRTVSLLLRLYAIQIKRSVPTPNSSVPL